MQQTYIRTKDGLYVAAAIRKPKGDGPFSAIVMFHGAPGGRGMEQITGGSRGADRSAVAARKSHDASGVEATGPAIGGSASPTRDERRTIGGDARVTF